MQHHENTYIALLRGINVGGNHKVPMAELRNEMVKLGFQNVRTLLNSGNVLFESLSGHGDELEQEISHHLENRFGFRIPVLIRKAGLILEAVESKPFEQVTVTKDTRLYITFLKEEPSTTLNYPWTSVDGSYQILEVKDRLIYSVLDLAVTKTPKGMDALELLFGKNLTTRNWNTILRLADQLN